MATKKNISDAAEVVRAGQYDALVSVRDLIETFATGLEGVKDKLPASLPMEALRQVDELLGSLAYRRSEMPNLIAKYEAVPTVEA